MRLLEKRAVTVVLLALNALLVAVLSMQVNRAPQVAATPVKPALDGEVRLDLPLRRPVMASLDTYQEISERPLFWSERRQVEELTVAGSDSAQTVMPFVLLGVVSGTRSKALLSKNGGKEVNRVAVGDVVEGWRIEAVNRLGVVLVSGNVRKELQVTPGLSQGK